MSQESKTFFERFPEFRTLAADAVDLLKEACETAGDMFLKAADALSRTRAKVVAAPAVADPPASAAE